MLPPLPSAPIDHTRDALYLVINQKSFEEAYPSPSWEENISPYLKSPTLPVNVVVTLLFASFKHTLVVSLDAVWHTANL